MSTFCKANYILEWCGDWWIEGFFTSYTKVCSVSYDSGSIPEQSIFSLRGTSPLSKEAEAIGNPILKILSFEMDPINTQTPHSEPRP